MITESRDLPGHFKDPLVELTCELVRVPSVSDARGGDELRVQQLMAQRMQHAGARVRTFEAKDVPAFFTHPLCHEAGRNYHDRPTVIGEIGPADAPALLVLAHSDTVPLFDPDLWTVDPFAAIVRDGKIIGLGASDDKWGLAAMVIMIEALQASPMTLKKRVIFASTMDEESGVGNGTLLLHLAGVRADAALYLDGYRMEIFVGCLGGSNLILRPRQPMTKTQLERHLPELTQACAALSAKRAPLFDRPMFAHNAWRDRSAGIFLRSDHKGDHLLLPFYTLPGETNESMQRELESAVDAALGTAANQFSKTYRPPWFEPALVPPNTPFVAHMTAAARDVLGHDPLVTTICKQDSFVLTNHANTPTISFGPTSRTAGPGAFHFPDECLEIQDLWTATSVAYNAIIRWLQTP